LLSEIMEPNQYHSTLLMHHPTPHVYWLSPDARTDRPILGAVAGRDATLIVDAGNSPAHASLFLERLSKIRLAPLRFLALTHWHWDHIFGSASFDLPTFASLETRQKVIELAGLDRRVAEGTEIAFCRDNIKKELPGPNRQVLIRPPEIGFQSRVEIDLGGVTCILVRAGGDHHPGSTVIYVEEDRLMFIGDCLAEDYYSGERSYTVANLFPLIDCLLCYEVETYLEGHAVQAISRQQMVEDAHLLKTIGREVEQIGQDRDAIRAALSSRLGRPLNPDDLEIMDSFLAGQRKSALPAQA
jgi:glyoxylase-like metal-dependent hydrolase (beta-lactamase superfamily II)